MDYLFKNLTTDDYTNIYFWLLLIFMLLGSLLVRHLNSTDFDKYLRTDRNILIVFVLTLIFLFGTRGMRIGTDTWNYYHFFYLKGINIDHSIGAFFGYFNTDFIFEVIMYLTFPFKSFTFFLFTACLIFNIGVYLFARKFTDYGHSGSSLLMFLGLASSFVFVSQQINIIRNGLAIPFLLFGMYYLNNKQLKKGIIFLFISYLCHGTILIPIACIILARIGNKIQLKYFLLFYVIAIGLSFVGFGFDKIVFLDSLGGKYFERLSLVGDTTYRIGFRPDFVLYNTLFLVLFLKFISIKDKLSLFLIKYFILASVIFYFNFNIPFSDRIGAYSWIAIPLLFNTIIKNRFPGKLLHYLTIVTIAYFSINLIILPYLSSSRKDDKKTTYNLLRNKPLKIYKNNENSEEIMEIIIKKGNNKSILSKVVCVA